MNLLDQQSDFSKMSAGDIFNSTIVPIFQQLDENAARIEQQRMAQSDQLLQGSNETTDLLMALSQGPQTDMGMDTDYNAPVVSQQLSVAPQMSVSPQGGVVTAPQQAPKQTAPSGEQKGGFKLSNYGYDSDSSPDYNSNVRRVGHAENKLEDGVSAALSKDLARQYGLKTGDFFEAVTADGQVLKRRYDDTVPRTYKGKPLPLTVDLYELGGSNKFGGKVLEIRPLSR